MVTQPHRARGVKVLKAVSSPLRLQILNLLFDKSALSYTELMNSLKMNPSRDAGRFAYHLKFLLKAGLVEADVEAKKYYLTDLGKMVLDVADRVEKKAFKPKGMLVRTSHFTLEEFDANKIANSLIKEAKVPPELAQKAAKEAEKRLLKSKTKYLTASLIREVVNGILVEKGFEDYRHKLTRVGMPIHEVTASIESKDHRPQDSSSILTKAGQTVLGEYTLLNIFPRDIADAHLSGMIHIGDLGTWILKPNEVVHDLRFFFKNGLKLDDLNKIPIESPSDLESALTIAFNVLLYAGREINHQQIYNYFNVFLAPFVKGVDPEKIKKNLQLFLLDVNQHSKVTLGLELSIPKSLADKPAITPKGQIDGKYGDYVFESRLLAELIIDVYAEVSLVKPLLSPCVVLKISKEVLSDEKAQAVLLKAHDIAAEKGTLYLANMLAKESGYTAFSSSGVKLAPDLTGDWETDTLRTGCLGYVTINLPRIVQECEMDKNKFFDLLKERYELAARALGIKYSVLKQYGKNSLPFLLKSSNGDTYFRLENCSRIINLAGLQEAVESFTGKGIHEAESRKFIDEIITNISSFKHKIGRKHGKRLYQAILGSSEASERLAQLDIEKYGIVKIGFSGTRDKPYYSTSKRLKVKTEPLSVKSEALDLMQRLKGLNAGGSLEIVELDTVEFKPEELMALTRRLIESSQPLEFFTYNRIITYCDNCKKSWFGSLHKCPSCGAMSTLGTFDRFSFT
jgi:anaerobic ribonucleoside-triphosphate reductase